VANLWKFWKKQQKKEAMNSARKLNHFFRKYLIISMKILRVAFSDTIKQDGIEHAGYLAFLSIFSLFPFLIFLIAIIGYVGGNDVGAKMIYNIINSLPKDAATAMMPRVDEIISGPPQNFLTIAIIGVVWTASSSVEGLRTILNRAYRVHFPPPYIFRRLISIIEFFIVTFGIVVVIMIFVIAPSILKIIENRFFINFNINYDWFYFRHLATFVFLVLSASLLYYTIPNVKQKITQTLPGALLAVLLWVFTENIFSFYLDNFHQFSLVYGGLAGIMISLMFFYLVNLIFIFGAEFNYHFHRIYKVLLKK
jgi:membrane protein